VRRKLGASFGPAIRVATLGIAEELKTDLARYPGPAHHPVIWGSKAEQLAYIIARRKDGLPLKYTRISDPWSKNLGKSWTTGRYGKLGAVVGTRGVHYARPVQKWGAQSAQHKATGWRTDKEAAEKVVKSGVAKKLVLKAIRHRLRGG